MQNTDIPGDKLPNFFNTSKVWGKREIQNDFEILSEEQLRIIYMLIKRIKL